MRPVVALYSTFFSRAFDQANLDVGLHGLPVVMVLDRAGITGDDGPSHHGVLDMTLALSIPGVTLFTPSSAEEVEVMLAEALSLPGPSVIRFPKTPAPWKPPGTVGSGLEARQVLTGDGSACILAVGKMLSAAEEAAVELAADGMDVSVWDVRVVSDPDPAMLADAARHAVVVTAEDGIRLGGAGTYLAEALRRSCPIGSAPPVVSLGIPRSYLAQDKPDRILARLGLDGPGLARSVREAVGGIAGSVTGSITGPVGASRAVGLSGGNGISGATGISVPGPADGSPTIPVITAKDALD
jgi:1-deoxy-D-xylulose-5-phosphate synthase